MRDNIKTAQEKQRKDYKKRTARGRTYEEFKVGDKVLMEKSRDANRKAKQGLGPHYTGPYVIVEVKGLNARLKNENGVVLKKTVSFNRLKKFHSERDQESTRQQDADDDQETDNTHKSKPREDDHRQKTENTQNSMPTTDEKKTNSKTKMPESSSKENVTTYISTMFEDGQLQQLINLVAAIDLPKPTSQQQQPFWNNTCPVSSFAAEVGWY